MMKKMKRVSMESSPFAIEEAKNRFKLQNLIRDFDELQKETEDIKENLEKMKQKRLTLLAEVSFLRRRYKHLVKNPSQKTLAEHPQSQKQNPRMVRGAARMKERKPKEKEVVKRNPHPSFDLNQISNPGDENMEFHVVWEPLSTDKELKRCSIEGGEDLSSNLNLSMCRDVGNGSNRTGKRKITWEDQVALRV